MTVRRIVGVAAGTVAVALATSGPAFASGGDMPSLVHDIGIALFVSGILAVVFTRIGIPAIAGFIIAGVLVGPLGLGWVTDGANIDTIAQLGFVLLLFMIGLEIDFAKIRAAGRAIVVSGLLQPPLTIAFGFLVTKAVALSGFGGGMLDGNLTAFYIGAVIAGSSTLIVVKLFQESFELDTTPGRLSLGLLIFQDLWATVLILLQPRFQHPEVGPIIGSFAGIALLAGVAVIVSIICLPIAFRWIAKVPEVVLLAAIGWCFLVVMVGANLDFAASMVMHTELHLNVGSGMGALIAGATIASLPYNTEIVTKVGVVKDFFVTLFFVGLGLGIEMPAGPEAVILAFGIAVLAIVARQIVFFPLLYFSGADQRNAEVTSIRLAQISEFGLVIVFLGLQYGHVTKELSSAIVLAFVLTALLTVPLYKGAYRLHEGLRGFLTAIGFREPPELDEGAEKEWRLALLGFHRVASSLLHNLGRDDPALVRETLIVDFNVALHDRIRAAGAQVEYGDLANPDTLHHAGVDRARVIVSTVPDDLMRGIDNRRLVEAVRKLNPSAIIIANAVNLADTPSIYAAGADYVFLSRLDAAAALAEAIGEALNGTLGVYRADREKEHGKPETRGEVLG